MCCRCSSDNSPTKIIGATPANAGAQCVCEAQITKRSRFTPCLLLSRRATSSVIEPGTPRLSSVISTAGPSASLPMARALAHSALLDPFELGLAVAVAGHPHGVAGRDVNSRQPDFPHCFGPPQPWAGKQPGNARPGDYCSNTTHRSTSRRQYVGDDGRRPPYISLELRTSTTTTTAAVTAALRVYLSGTIASK